jgi:homeobox-leucine zipper protein
MRPHQLYSVEFNPSLYFYNDCLDGSQGVNSSQNGQLILQESFTDLSGSLVVVYSPIDFASVNMVVSGEDPSVIPLLPSGFSILPDGSSVPPACVLTVAHQMVVNSPPSCSLSAEYVNNINNLVTSTVQQVRAAFNYAGGL